MKAFIFTIPNPVPRNTPPPNRKWCILLFKSSWFWEWTEETIFFFLEWPPCLNRKRKKKKKSHVEEFKLHSKELLLSERHIAYKKISNSQLKVVWSPTQPCITSTALLNISNPASVWSQRLTQQAEKSTLLLIPLWKHCHLPSHSDRYNYRVELGKHSLEASEEGSIARRAATIITHEDYNILLSR